MPDPLGGGGDFKAAADALKTFGELIRPFTDPVFSELGEYIRDKVRYLRFKNTVYTIHKARELLVERGLELKPVPPKVLVSILEGAALEEDDELVDRWARLLATAGSGETVHPSFPTILAQLQPVDARILEVLGVELDRRAEIGLLIDQWVEGTLGQSIRDSLGIDLDTFIFSILNLIRLGLVERTINIHGVSLEVVHDTGGYVLTVFGIGFVRACRGPLKKSTG